MSICMEYELNEIDSLMVCIDAAECDDVEIYISVQSHSVVNGGYRCMQGAWTTMLVGNDGSALSEFVAQLAAVLDDDTVSVASWRGAVDRQGLSVRCDEPDSDFCVVFLGDTDGTRYSTDMARDDLHDLYRFFAVVNENYQAVAVQV